MTSNATGAVVTLMLATACQGDDAPSGAAWESWPALAMDPASTSGMETTGGSTSDDASPEQDDATTSSSGSSGGSSGSPDDASPECGEEDGPPCTPGFGYPVGDLVTPPAGGWYVSQVLGHYLNFGSFVGGHLAQDIASGNEATTANATVHAIGDGTVLYAGPNGSTYVNVVLIEHDLGPEGIVCSFYGHLGSVYAVEGAHVERGEPIATVLDWGAYFGSANSHLHYVVLSADLCAASDAADGALICGYDATSGPNGIETLDDEPYAYTSLGDPCGTQQFSDAFISPSQFIASHPPA